MYINSGDTVKVWLNGQVIGSRDAETLGCRTVHVPAAFDPTVCTPDRVSHLSSLPMDLKAGENLLLVEK